MDSRYDIADTHEIISPALVVFEEVLIENIQKMIEIAGSADRLRPHCKTHKMREVAELQLKLGITKHKCATFAEAEMLARAGVKDIFLAYNLVGPNVQRAVAFLEKFPDVTLAVTADHTLPITVLGNAMSSAGRTIDVLLDLDTGMHRTGVPLGPEAKRLYEQIAHSPGLRAGGLHLYDGQNHQTPLDERTAAVQGVWEPVARFRDELVAADLPVPKIVCGGTGSFPVFAQIDDAAIELSPGTCVFHDAGYGEMFPDLDFAPAQMILTRVISRPADDLMTLDLGYKACASDRPAGRRLLFPDLPEAAEVLQNEEHLVLKTPLAKNYEPGDELLAVARHACPTSAMHKQAYIIREGQLAEHWDVVARDRWLTV
jgi:D-serine deaminase-like pyridoxal phosphate-dependent protein